MSPESFAAYLVVCRTYNVMAAGFEIPEIDPITKAVSVAKVSVTFGPDTVAPLVDGDAPTPGDWKGGPVGLDLPFDAPDEVVP